MLPNVIDYVGEYGSEVSVFIPYIHYLKQVGLLHGKKVAIYDGMQPYYFFLAPDDVIIKKDKRQYIPYYGRFFMPDHLRNEDEIFRVGGTLKEYLPPDYKNKYADMFQSKKPLVVVQNKFNSEWGHPPMNYFDLAELRHMFDALEEHYHIVYIRSNQYRGQGYSYDQNEESEYRLDDIPMIKNEYPSVTLYEDLVSRGKKYDFNTMKCMLLASAHMTISTIGGFNHFDAYFPCKHIIFRKNASMLYDRTWYQNQHDLCCPGRSTPIYFASSFGEVMKHIQDIQSEKTQ